MKAIRYTLHLLEPVLVAQAGAGEENSATGLPYIPGSALRGALAGRWLAHHPNVNFATDPASRAAFLDGAVSYLNAYPLYNGQRTLPKPASWMVEKESADDPRSTITDIAVAASSGLLSPKPPEGGFCLLVEVKPEEPWEPKEYATTFLKSSYFEQLHISLEEANVRDDRNTIFRYDALAAGQRFGGVIVGADDADLSELQKLLAEGDLALGSAQMAGYGRMAVEEIQLVDDWQEYTPYDPADSTRLVLTLLSPAILRGRTGQVGWDDGQALAQALGCPAATKPLAAFGRLAFVGGYNRKWSLPLPQDWALAAGSVFVLEAQDVDPAKLHSAMEQGIGERRAEGFGRIAAHWQAAPQIRQRERETVTPDAPTLSDKSQRQAQAMAQRRLRLDLDRRLTQQVNRTVDAIRRPPKNSQLSAIRQAVMPVLAGNSPQPRMQPLLDHLNGLKKAGRSQLERCRLSNQTLFQWLSERAEGLDVQEQLLHGDPLPTVAGQRATLDLSFRVEYTARLIDGVMQLTARRSEETGS